MKGGENWKCLMWKIYFGWVKEIDDLKLNGAKIAKILVDFVILRKEWRDLQHCM